MISLEAIRERARADLVIRTRQGQEDTHLWEHSLRVVEMATQLAQLPEFAPRQADLIVLTAVAFYHDAGWVVQHNDGEIDRQAILGKPASPWQRELGAALMERSLGRLLPKNTLEVVSACIRTLSDRSLDIFEAQLVREAENLDEFGAVAIWNAARRNALEGKSLGAAIDTWRTQREYGYWSTRIKDSFMFEPVRQIALERLRVFERIVADLCRHHAVEDIRGGRGAEATASLPGRLPA